MNIVFVEEHFRPNKGYIEYYLPRELAKLNNDITVISSKKVKRITELTIDNFRVIYIPTWFSLHSQSYHFFRPREVSNIHKIIKEISPEVVYCYLLFSPLPLLFMKYERMFNYKIVGNIVTQEYSLSSIINKIGFSFFKIIINQYVKNKVKLVFAKTNEVKDLLIRVYDIPPEKICIMPLGADPDLFKFNPVARGRIRALLGLSREDIVVVYSGKINPIKEIGILIKALAPIIKKNDKVKLLIIGEGDPLYIAYLKKLILKLKISNNVIFNSWVHRTVLPDFYSASDIAVWPGLSSISIVEAASTGLPVIIKQSPIEKYALENNNGFIFERGNIEDLRKYLKILIYDEELRKEMGNKSRLLVEQKLNWRAIAKRYLNVFMQIL